MPFTPFHLGPALLLGLLFGLNLPIVLVASLVLDLEALYFMLISGAGYLHGFFHSYLGASILAMAFGFAFKKAFPKSPKSKKVFVSSFAGTYSHVFLDSFLYPDMQPLWPVLANPFLGILGPSEVYALSVVALIIGVALYAAGKIKNLG